LRENWSSTSSVASAERRWTRRVLLCDQALVQRDRNARGSVVDRRVAPKPLPRLKSSNQKCSTSETQGGSEAVPASGAEVLLTD
jgi:hypothetical protein